MTVGKNITTESSLKRLAWAYGCAKKGSEDEANLRKLLLFKMEKERRADGSIFDRELGRLGLHIEVEDP